MKLSKTKQNGQKEFDYYLEQYEESVKRYSYWRNHPSNSSQLSGMLDRSSESAKTHLYAALMKYMINLNLVEKSLKGRDEKLQMLTNSIVSNFEKNGLGKKIVGSKGRMVSKLLNLAIKEGSFQDLKHNPAETTEEQSEIELEYRDTVAHLFRHPGVAKDTSKILSLHFGKLGE